MDTSQRFSLYGVCMVATVFIGCAAPYPYQPYQTYPYQSYPGGMYGQPGYIAPGSTIPGGTTPTPIDPGSTGGGDAPMWEPEGDTGGGTGGTGGNNSVPFYDDPSSSGDLGPAPSTSKPDMFDDDKNAFGGDANPFGTSQTTESESSKNVAFNEDKTPEKTTEMPPVLQLGAEGSTKLTRSDETTDPLGAPSPITLSAAEFSQPIERSEEPDGLELPYNPEEMPNPFGHDTAGFRYLRGLVSYDDESRSWSIIYNDKPSRDDEYGGVFTLADHPGLTVLNDNDVVYIEGHVSETLTDAYGKPRYIVEHLNKLKPRSAE